MNLYRIIRKITKKALARLCMPNCIYLVCYIYFRSKAVFEGSRQVNLDLDFVQFVTHQLAVLVILKEMRLSG